MYQTSTPVKPGEVMQQDEEEEEETPANTSDIVYIGIQYTYTLYREN